MRAFSYIYNILNTEKYSCLSSLGDGNRVLCVLKIKENSTFPSGFSYKIDAESSNLLEYHISNNILQGYLDKLLLNNIVIKEDNVYELYVKILHFDGNIWDLLTYTIFKFLNEDNIKEKVEILQQVKSLTFAENNNYLICDTSIEEYLTSSCIFNILLFSNEEFEVFKIKGRSIKIESLSKVLQIVKSI